MPKKPWILKLTSTHRTRRATRIFYHSCFDIKKVNNLVITEI